MRRRDFLWACVSSIMGCQSIEISPYHYNVDPAKSILVRLLPSLSAAIISPSLQKSAPKLPAFLAPNILRRKFPAMPKSGIVVLLFVVFLQSSLIFSQSSKAPTSTPWRTLAGNAPVVIAKGGFSGLVPDSSYYAYSIASLISLPNVIMWCDVQLTKDNVGICASNIMLDNVTDIHFLFKDNKKSYIVNGERLEGWFSVDYTVKDLSDVHLIQSILSRSDKYDGDLFPILTVEKVAQLVKPPGLWLNIQHDMFFKQHNLSMRNFVHSVSRRVIIDYISSPEVAFLTNIGAMFNRSKTKLVFRFLEPEVTEPSTNQTYGSLLKNLTFLKTFASGILVPKGYIWPVNVDLYLQPHTSLVLDAHKEGLEVFASDFMNDVPLSYNYSYDPLAEILSFIDNTDFSVDGVLSDFPITPSEAIGCFSHINKNSSEYEKPIIISHNGASGMYAGSTDLAYRQAVEDGADVIDCSVQMTKDGIPICLNSINLFDGTTVVQSPFSSHFATIPEIQANAGIFAFNLTWKEIQSLRPAISIPYMHYDLKRNPAYANAGNFMTLSDFLIFSKGKPITGILISIENAAYLAEKQGLGVTDAVLSALKHAGYDNQVHLEVTIQSTDSAVLKKLKQQTDFKLMYMVDESIRDAVNSSLKAIKQFSDSVAINKVSVYPSSASFLTGMTNLIPKLQSFGLTVYVYVFRNEFVSQAWDYFSDPTVEINSYVQGAGVDGIITDFPGTARAYRRNSCLKMGSGMPVYMTPVQPGGLLQLIAAQFLPPAEAPLPVLTESDIAEPPLPSVTVRPPVSGIGGNLLGPTSPPPSSGPPHCNACIFIALSMLLLASLLIL